MPRSFHPKWAFALIVISAFINVLALSGSLFMLQVYDRVLASRSVETLVGLFVIVALAYAALTIFETIRARVLARLAVDYEQRLSNNLISIALSTKRGSIDLGLTREVESVRAALASPAFGALFDLPWMPLYLALVFILHPILGWLTVLGAGALCLIAAAAAYAVRSQLSQTLPLAVRRQEALAVIRGNSDAIIGLGMAGSLSRRWLSAVTASIESQIGISDRQQAFANISRNFRQLLQSALLATGAYLVIRGEMSGGSIIASSIIGSKALAPVEALIGGWGQLSAGYRARAKLKSLGIESPAGAPPPLNMPKPAKSLGLDAVSATKPGSQQNLFPGISAVFEAGSVVAIIGESGSGKSTLLRAIGGVNRTIEGQILFDSVPSDQWDQDALGMSLGYLPQDFQLLDGTIADIIARGNPNRRDDEVLRAAELAGIHPMIASLPHGYNTDVGAGGSRLSGGQKQRVALARALYGDPFVLLLDEPNSNLDKNGDNALLKAIIGARSAGRITVVATHRPEILAVADYVIRLPNGSVHRLAQTKPTAEAA